MAAVKIDWHNMKEYTKVPMQYWLVDKIELDVGEKAVGYKAVSSQDWYFKNHFPGYPVMPGVILMEAMKFLGKVLADATFNGEDDYVLYECRSLRIYNSVRPGDMLKTEVQLLSVENKTVKFSGAAKVMDGAEENVICSAEFVLIPEAERKARKPTHSEFDKTEKMPKGNECVVLDWNNLQDHLAGLKEMCFVDRVDAVPGKEAWGTKLLSAQDWFLPMSDPQAPAMPDGFAMEIIMQAGACAASTMPQVKNDPILFYGCEALRVYDEAHPGDILQAHTRLRYFNRGVAKLEGALYCRMPFGGGYA